MSETILARPSHYARNEGVVARALGEEMVLLNLASGLYYSLNDVGAFIWSWIEQRAPHGEIARAIVDTYDVAPEQAVGDLDAFLGKLNEWGLVVSQ